jgi:hypothetical protein
MLLDEGLNERALRITFKPSVRTWSSASLISFEPIPFPPSSGGTSVWMNVITPSEIL